MMYLVLNTVHIFSLAVYRFRNNLLNYGLLFVVAMPKHSKNSKLALIGLIILFAYSLVMAGGRIPKIEQINISMRTLSGNEAKVLIERIPEIFTDALGKAASDFKTDEITELKQDTGFLNANLKPKELGISLLQTVFPNAHFYQLRKLDMRPHYSYLIAILGNKLYHPTIEFNHLLIDQGLTVNDKNIIELAKAFVIIALEGKEITFLEGKRIKEGYRLLHIEWDVEIKCRIDGEVQTWKFSQFRYYSKGKWIKIGQLAAAMSFVNNKALRYYQINRVVQEEE